MRTLDPAAFSNLPYQRLQEVKICVEPTEDTARRDDAGQMICLFFKIRDVVDIIVQAAEGGLRSLNFDLVESERGKWYEGGMPKRTISQIQDVPTYMPRIRFHYCLVSVLSIASAVSKHGSDTRSSKKVV